MNATHKTLAKAGRSLFYCLLLPSFGAIGDAPNNESPFRAEGYQLLREAEEVLRSLGLGVVEPFK